MDNYKGWTLNRLTHMDSCSDPGATLSNIMSRIRISPAVHMNPTMHDPTLTVVNADRTGSG
jgi:hypothetical protein